MILSASAFILDDTDDNGVDGADQPVFAFTDDGTTSTVTGFTPKDYAGPLTIPAVSTNNNPVTAIGNGAFADCTGLTSLTIPNGVTSIGSSAFYKCSGLTSLTIPGSVTSIGARAFFSCTGLTGALTIPVGVTSIGEGAFGSCTSLTGINVDPANQNYSDIDGVLFDKNKTELKCCPAGKADCTIPVSVTSIGDLAFSGCTGLTGALTIPNGVTSIGSSAFYNCTGLTGALTIPNGVTSIGAGAFSGCSKLTSLTVPGSVKSIENNAFINCSRLISLTISNGVTSIGAGAFSGCSKLTSLTVPGSVTNISDTAFKSCTSLTEINVDPANQNYSDVDGVLFNKNKTELKCCPAGKADCTIPVSVTSIGDLAFDGCSKLTSLTIPVGVTSIGDGAFWNCSKLTSLTIPNGVTNIGMKTFYNCDGLTSLTIPGSVTSIGMVAFADCSGLTSLTIPNGVTSIETDAFYGCSGLTSCTVTGSPTADGILEKYFTATGGWKLPGMSTAFSTLTIDSDKALDLKDIAGSDGRSVIFTGKSIGTIGGTFNDDGKTLSGGERAGKTFRCFGSEFKTAFEVTVNGISNGKVSYSIEKGTSESVQNSSPVYVPKGATATFTATPDADCRFGGWTVNGEPIVFTLPLDFKPSQDCKITVSFAKVVTDASAGTTSLEFQGGLKVELSTADLGSNYIGLRETSVPGYQKAFELTAPGLDGKTLRITIPFDPIRGHTPSVCFLDPNGGQPVPMRIIEVTATSITFETDHNSTYVLQYVPIPNNNHTPDEPAVNPPSTVVPSGKEPVEEDNGALYVIAAAAAAIAVLLVATYNLYGRK